MSRKQLKAPKRSNKVFPGPAGYHPAPRSPGQEAGLEEKGFADILEGIGLLVENRGQRIDPDRTTVEFIDNRAHEKPVEIVEAVAVDLEAVKSGSGGFAGDGIEAVDLGEL